MSHRTLALAPILATLTLAAPALADPTQVSPSVTATGSAEVKVVPANRHSNASIAAAVDAAAKKAVPAALQAAHEEALMYAQDAGLTLGAVQSVSDVTNGNFYAYGSNEILGPFGPNRYCGTQTRRVIRKVGNKIKVGKPKRVHVCIVPPYASSTLTVTYSAS